MKNVNVNANVSSATATFVVAWRTECGGSYSEGVMPAEYATEAEAEAEAIRLQTWEDCGPTGPVTEYWVEESSARREWEHKAHCALREEVLDLVEDWHLDVEEVVQRAPLPREEW